MCRFLATSRARASTLEGRGEGAADRGEVTLGATVERPPGSEGRIARIARIARITGWSLAVPLNKNRRGEEMNLGMMGLVKWRIGIKIRRIVI